MTPRASFGHLVRVGVLTVGLVLTAAMPAGAYVRHPTPGGQADAQAAILTRADLASANGWKGGPVKPDTSDATGCPGYQPKSSDLVITGDKKSSFERGSLSIDSEASVLATAKMERLDWQRTVKVPGVLACLRRIIGLQSNVRLVSAASLPFQKVATYSAAYRVVFETAAKAQVRVDLILFGRGRTENTLTVTSLTSDASVPATEIRLARLLASRIRA